MISFHTQGNCNRSPKYGLKGEIESRRTSSPIGWYEGENRKAKALPSKELASHFKHIKYAQLNSDVFTGVGTSLTWMSLRVKFHVANYRVVNDSLKAGKHVIVEKPLAGNIEQAHDMLKLTQEYSVAFS